MDFCGEDHFTRSEELRVQLRFRMLSRWSASVCAAKIPTGHWWQTRWAYGCEYVGAVGGV